MAKIAVDIALLLPKEVNDICVEINRKDAEASSDLSKDDNYPHITLAMGVIDEKDLLEVETKLKEISSNFSSLQLEILDIYFKITPEKKKSYGFTIRLTDELKNLHKMIMEKLLPIFSYDVSNSMFFLDSDENFNEVSKHWVKNYGKKHSNPDNYHPHISLKCRKAEYSKFPIKFTSSKLVVCHLGNHCTCRKVLVSVELQ